MTWWIAGATLVSAGVGAYSSNQASKAAAKGDTQAIAEQKREFDVVTGLQKPYNVTGTGALNKLAQLYGLPYSPYQDPSSAASPSAGLTPRTGTTSGSGGIGGALGIAGGILGLGGSGYKKPKGTLGTDQVIKLLKSGMTPEEVAKLYPMSSRHPPRALKKLTALGLSADQINMLYGGPAGLAQKAAADAQAKANPGMVNGIVTPTGPDMSVFQTSPDYQFRKQQGTEAVDRTAAARSGALGGNVIQAQTQYASDLASTEFASFFSRLATIAGIGQTAAGQTSQAAQNTGANISSLLSDRGAARASGIMGVGNSATGAINSGLTAYLLNKGGYFDKAA